MKHIKEFSRFAHIYNEYNVIQKQVAKDLLGLVDNNAKNIVDLGCGSGTLYNSLTWDIDSYIGIDLSQNMLDNHPHDSKVSLLCESFDDSKLFAMLKDANIDILLSSSSLQWSHDLKKLFKSIKGLEKPIALSLFTSATFDTLHKTAKTSSPLYSKEMIEHYANAILGLSVIYKKYELDFTSSKELFSYLKKSGVSSNSKQLSYKETKLLMKEYPLTYLEFEVAFITTALA